jgi:hypothetical protein
MPDPSLTPHGVKQCRNLLVAFPFHSQVEMIVASPLRRTLYTAFLGFEGVLKEKELKIIAMPEIQETSDVVCDIGSDLSTLEQEIREKGLPVELGLLTEGWNIKVSRPWKLKKSTEKCFGLCRFMESS